MQRIGKVRLKSAAAACAIVLLAGGMNVVAADYLSPVSLAADSAGKTLYVAQETADQVAVLDVASGKVTKTIALKAPAGNVVLSADGSTLYATAGGPAGKVCVIDTKKNKIDKEIDVGHTPLAPVLSPDGKTLYVCNRFNNNVAVIDLGSGKVEAEIPVEREPVAAAITPDGKTLYVANHLPAGAADGAYSAALISAIDTASRTVAAKIQLPNGCTDLRGACVSPDGKFVYVSHILARYQLPTTQLERGWMNTNAFTIIDAAERKAVNTVLLDSIDLGAANPWGIACTADGKYLCVTHAGTHEISRIDLAALHAKLDRAAKGEKVSDATDSVDDVPNDLSFLVDVRERIRLSGNGPRGLALIGTKAYAAEYFSDSIGVVDIDPEVRPRPESLALGKPVKLSQERLGERIFNDADICFQKWQSCASCHPDVRTDGLNWDLLNDGFGNPKNTKNLMLAHKTAPAMVTGVRPNAETGVRAGIKFILFAVRPEEDAEAIDAFLKSVEPTPSPYLVNGKLSDAAKRGEKLYEKAGCGQCHPAPLGTDKKKYDVGTGKDRDEGLEFDTPSIIEAWRNGPYLYDGRAATMKDVITKFNNDDKHGVTSKLSDKEVADLVEFVLSQ